MFEKLLNLSGKKLRRKVNEKNHVFDVRQCTSQTRAWRKLPCSSDDGVNRNGCLKKYLNLYRKNTWLGLQWGGRMRKNLGIPNSFLFLSPPAPFFRYWQRRWPCPTIIVLFAPATGVVAMTIAAVDSSGAVVFSSAHSLSFFPTHTVEGREGALFNPIHDMCRSPILSHVHIRRSYVCARAVCIANELMIYGETRTGTSEDGSANYSHL